jgi:hypothetical protein
VEDLNLLNLASLQAGEHLDLPTGASRPLEARALAVDLTARAEYSRHAVTQVLEKEGLPGSFRVVRGRVHAEILGAALEADLLVLGMASSRSGPHFAVTARAIVEAASRLLLLPRDAPLSGPVRVAYDATPGAEVALVEGARLARSLGCALGLLLMDGDDDLRSVLARHPALTGLSDELSLTSQRLPQAGAADLATLLRAARDAILVLDADRWVTGHSEELVRRLIGPVLLVRGTAGAASDK